MGIEVSAKNGMIRLASVAIIALVIGVALGYFLAGPSPAQPTMSLSTNAVVRGGQYQVSLTGFPANTAIHGWVVNENPPRTFEAGTTDANGALNLNGTAPQTPGPWLLCASDANNEYWAEAVMTVT